MTRESLDSLLGFLKAKRTAVDDDIEKVVRRISHLERDAVFDAGVRAGQSGMLPNKKKGTHNQ